MSIRAAFHNVRFSRAPLGDCRLVPCFFATVASATAAFHYATDGIAGRVFPLLGLLAAFFLTSLILWNPIGKTDEVSYRPSGSTLGLIGSLSCVLMLVLLSLPGFIPLSAKMDGANHLLIVRKLDELSGHFAFLLQEHRASLVAWGFHGFSLSLSDLVDVAPYRVIWFLVSSALMFSLHLMAVSSSAVRAGWSATALTFVLFWFSPWTLYAVLNFDYWTQAFGVFQILCLLELCQMHRPQLFAWISLLALGVPLVHPMFLAPVLFLWGTSAYGYARYIRTAATDSREYVRLGACLTLAVAAYVPAVLLLRSHFEGFSVRGSPLYLISFRGMVSEWQIWVYLVPCAGGFLLFFRKHPPLTIVIAAVLFQAAISVGTNPRSYISYKSLMSAAFLALPFAAMAVSELSTSIPQRVRAPVHLGLAVLLVMVSTNLVGTLERGVDPDAIAVRRWITANHPTDEVHTAVTPAQKRWLSAIVPGNRIPFSREDFLRPWEKGDSFDEREECREIRASSRVGILAMTRDTLDECAFDRLPYQPWRRLHTIGDYAAFKRDS